MDGRIHASCIPIVKKANSTKEMESSHDSHTVHRHLAKRKFSARFETQQRLGGLASVIFRGWKSGTRPSGIFGKGVLPFTSPDQTGTMTNCDEPPAFGSTKISTESDKGEGFNEVNGSSACNPVDSSSREYQHAFPDGMSGVSEPLSPKSEDDAESPKCIVSAGLDTQHGNAIFAVRTIKTLQKWIDESPRSHSSICAELEIANISISGLNLPDLSKLIPVHESCPFLPIMDLCGIRPQSVVLGASYFQRLLHFKPAMMHLAKKSGWFPDTFNASTGERRTEMRAVFNGPRSSGMLATYAACVYIAAKFSDTIGYKGLLSALLHAILGLRIPKNVAVDLEAKCLAKLQWRLAPVFDSVN